MDRPDLLHAEISEQVNKAFYQTYNTLGYGFLEKVYENAMAIALRRRGLSVIQQMPVKVFFDGELVGEYFADPVINQCLIVEVKAGEALHTAHEAQLINYLKASSVEVGLLCNFGETPEFRRKLFTNDRKPALPLALQSMDNRLPE